MAISPTVTPYLRNSMVVVQTLQLLVRNRLSRFSRTGFSSTSISSSYISFNPPELPIENSENLDLGSAILSVLTFLLVLSILGTFSKGKYSSLRLN